MFDKTLAELAQGLDTGDYSSVELTEAYLARINVEDTQYNSFISVTDESVALRRLWPRGLAIGVRGLILEVDASTGRVLRSGPMGQPLPHRPFTAPASAGPGA